MQSVGWSPEQIGGRLKLQHGENQALRVSHETIYATIYAQPRGELRRELLRDLRQQRKARRPRGRGRDRRDVLGDIVKIQQRPAEVEGREVPGHWEGDLIKGAGNKSSVATLVERHSRFIMMAKMEDASADSARVALVRRMRHLPACVRKSLTYDRGREMAQHQAIAAALKIDVFFCDPYSPWQRGSNENANGLIREYLPKGDDLSQYSQHYLNRVAMALNSRPRKILGFRTPLEVFSEILQREGFSTERVALRA
jgi:transposase, IS30 family